MERKIQTQYKMIKIDYFDKSKMFSNNSLSELLVHKTDMAGKVKSSCDVNLVA